MPWQNGWGLILSQKWGSMDSMRAMLVCILAVGLSLSARADDSSGSGHSESFAKAEHVRLSVEME